jgi:hypothetical protein
MLYYECFAITRFLNINVYSSMAIFMGKFQYILGTILTSLTVLALGMFAIPGVTFTQSSGSVTASVNVPLYCGITLNPTSISFGSVSPGSNVPTNVLVTDTNSAGNTQANVLIEGGNWISVSSSFGVSNTLWDSTTQTTYTGNALTLSLASTGETLSASAGSNTLYFGLAVPASQAAGVYSQTITIENSC